MAAPAYTWEFVYDLWGDRVPKIAILPAAASLDTVDGTLVYLNAGAVTAAGASSSTLLGIARETVTSATAGDPVRVELIGFGMVIRGTADADASALAPFVNKTVDLNADGSLDVADTSNGCLSVFKTSGTSDTIVDCVITESDMAAVN